MIYYLNRLQYSPSENMANITRKCVNRCVHRFYVKSPLILQCFVQHIVLKQLYGDQQENNDSNRVQFGCKAALKRKKKSVFCSAEVIE